MQQIQVTQITPDNLKALLSGVVIPYLEDLKEHFQPKEPLELLTRQETADFLKVDLSTIHNYTKKGILSAYGIGHRVYYKRSEIEGALVKLQK